MELSGKALQVPTPAILQVHVPLKAWYLICIPSLLQAWMLSTFSSPHCSYLWNIWAVIWQWANLKASSVDKIKWWNSWSENYLGKMLLEPSTCPRGRINLTVALHKHFWAFLNISQNEPSYGWLRSSEGVEPKSPQWLKLSKVSFLTQAVACMALSISFFELSCIVWILVKAALQTPLAGGGWVPHASPCSKALQNLWCFTHLTLNSFWQLIFAFPLGVSQWRNLLASF